MAYRSVLFFLGGASLAGAFGAYRLRSDINQSNNHITDRISIMHSDIIKVADRLTRRVDVLESKIQDLQNSAASQDQVNETIYKLENEIASMNTQIVALRDQVGALTQGESLLSQSIDEIIQQETVEEVPSSPSDQVDSLQGSIPESEVVAASISNSQTSIYPKLIADSKNLLN